MPTPRDPTGRRGAVGVYDRPSALRQPRLWLAVAAAVAVAAVSVALIL